jgi:hypothetical protein
MSSGRLRVAFLRVVSKLCASSLAGVVNFFVPTPSPGLEGEDRTSLCPYVAMAGAHHLPADLEPVGHSDAMADDLGRNPMLFVQGGWCGDVHGSSQDELSV